MADDHQTPPRATLAVLADPSRANAFGNLHGGEILKLADECGGLAAIRHAGGASVVTAAIDGFAFLGPVRIGERVEVSAVVSHVGRTSIEVRLTVHAEPLDRAERRKVAEGHAVFVALDPDGTKRLAPPLAAADEAAGRRHAARLERRREALGEV